jgi:hypothetical protein
MLKGISLLIVVSTAGLITAPPALAQQIHDELNREALQVQQGMNSGVFDQNQAIKLDSQIYQIEKQAQADQAMNGGQLNPIERQQLGSEVQNVRQNMRNTAIQNGYNPQAMLGQHGGMFGGEQKQNHHRFNGALSPYNQAQYQNANANGAYPYPNNAYASGGGFPNQNNGFFNGQPNNNYTNGSYANNQSQQRMLDGASQLLRKLF